MSRPIYNATVKATGQKVQVYKLDSGGYCNFSDCTTTYKKEELLINK